MIADSWNLYLECAIVFVTSCWGTPLFQELILPSWCQSHHDPSLLDALSVPHGVRCFSKLAQLEYSGKHTLTLILPLWR